MRKLRFVMALTAVLGGLGAGAARAELLTVSWDLADTTLGAGGTGQLGGLTVQYTTDAIPPNAGTTISNASFPIGAGTAPGVALFGGISDLSGGVLGAAYPGPSNQTITADGTLTDPVLIFNFVDPYEVFDFGALPFTVLSAAQVTRSGGLMTGDATAGNTAGDGFVIQLAGNYTEIQFTLAGGTSQGGRPEGQTVAFTVGQPRAQAVPEPASLAAALLGLGVVGVRSARRRAA